jgi:hypothetical protein
MMVKKTFRYLQGTKDLMLTYRRSDSLEIKGYSDGDYAGVKDRSGDQRGGSEWEPKKFFSKEMATPAR